MASAAPLDAKAASGRDASAATLTTDSLAMGIAVLAGLSVLQRCIGFGRSLLFCHLMTDAELGRWSLSFSFLLMAAPLAVLGLPGSFGRYFEYYRSRGQVRAFLRKTLSLTTILTLLFALAVVTFPEFVSALLLGTREHGALIGSLALALVLVVALNVTIELATAMRQARLVSIVQFIHSALFAIIACTLLAVTTLAARAVIFGYSAAAAIAIAIALVMLTRKVREVGEDTQPLDRTIWSRLVPYAAWMWVSDALFSLFDTADRLMIVHLSDTTLSTDALVGQYHSSRVIPTLVIAVSGMLAALILPYLSEHWEKDERKIVSRTTILALKLCSLLYVLGGAVLLMVAPMVFGTLLQGRYDEGLQVLPATLLYCIWFGLNIVGQNHLLCAEKAKWTSAALLLGLVVNVLLNAALLPWLGLSGAVAATTVANAVALLATLRCAKSFGLQVDRRTLFMVSLPLVLLLGWQATLLALLAIAAAIAGNQAIFDDHERQIIGDAWQRIGERVTRSRLAD